MADAKRLKEIPFENTGLTRKLAMRMVKLIKPRCELCDKKVYGWWERCQHTPIGPYHSMQAVEDPQAKLSFNSETGTWQEDPNKRQRIIDYRVIPNVVQIPLTIRVGTGLEVEAALVRGCKHPEDVKPLLPDGTPDPHFDGYAPVCEFQNCNRPNPKVKTTHPMLRQENRVPQKYWTAFYCSEDHARRARLKDSKEIRFIPEASQESAENAIEQLAKISL